MEILKSSRHSKITGDFAERLILYWLSKYGFECAYVDHVGLDIIARNPHNGEVMGISVKSRSRITGREDSSLNVSNEHVEKLQTACKAFNCQPYFALVIDARDSITVYILRTAHLLKLCPPGKVISSWSMTKAWQAKYISDPEIHTFHFSTRTGNWWQGKPN